MSALADPCCFAEVESELRRLAGQVDFLGFDLPVNPEAYIDWDELQAPYTTADRIVRGSVFDFDVWLQDFRFVWPALNDWCAEPWQVSSPRWPDGGSRDALRELPRAFRALDDVRDWLAGTHVDALPVSEQLLYRFLVDSTGLFAERLIRARDNAVPASWRRRFCLMAATSLRYPDIFEHRAEVRHSFARLTRIALTVLSTSGDPRFAAAETFETPLLDTPGADSSEFGRVVQSLRADPLLSEPDRVMAVCDWSPDISWVDDLLWWCGAVERGDWLVAAVPAVCAVQTTAGRTSYVDLGVGDPAVLDNPFLLDLALTVADVAPSDSNVEPLQFAEGVLASGVSADYRP